MPNELSAPALRWITEVIGAGRRITTVDRLRWAGGKRTTGSLSSTATGQRIAWCCATRQGCQIADPDSPQPAEAVAQQAWLPQRVVGEIGVFHAAW